MGSDVFIMIVLVVAISAGTSALVKIVRAVLAHLDNRNRGGDLSTSELKQLITSSVEEATWPLQRKIDRLEERLTVMSEAQGVPPSTAAKRLPPGEEASDQAVA